MSPLIPILHRIKSVIKGISGYEFTVVLPPQHDSDVIRDGAELTDNELILETGGQDVRFSIGMLPNRNLIILV